MTPPGKNHLYDQERMTSTPIIFGIPIGTMVENISRKPDPTNLHHTALREKGHSQHLLISYPRLCEELGIVGVERGDWGIQTNLYLTIVDLEVLSKGVHIVGPLAGLKYVDTMDEQQSEQMYPMGKRSYGRQTIPLGIMGIVVNRVCLKADKDFYGVSKRGGMFGEAPNFYIVYCTELLDVIKEGYYLWPASETKIFDKSKQAGITNLKICSIYADK